MLVLRRMGLGLLLWWVVVGCIKPQPEPKPVSTLPALRVPTRQLYRSLNTGMTPGAVWKVVCKRWSMGRCERLKPVGLRRELNLTGMRPYLPDLKIYAYQGQDELRCTHYFYFRHWGLMAVRVECKADLYKQIQSLKRRYYRWYDKPQKIRRSGSLYVYRWVKKEMDHWRVDLFVSLKKVTALHLDLRRRWHDIATSLEPSMVRSDIKSIRVWQKVPTPVKREVLVNTGHLIDRLKAMHLKSKYYQLSSTPWSPQQATEGCEPSPVSTPWSMGMWKNIGFQPKESTRLRYRLVQIYHYKKIGRTRAQRNYRIDAKGCGFQFKVSLRKSGVDWIYDPLIARVAGK